MENIKETLKRKLDKLAIGPAEKEAIQKALYPVLERNQERMEFLHTRTLKDKNIAINLLNQAIDDLQAKQQEIEAANQTLLLQKQQLEEQSKQLRDSLDRLEMSYEELEQFSYIASHDLKSPLRTIASYAQLLQRRYNGALDKDADEFLAFITSGARQMNDIIRDLLEYSFIQKQKDHFQTIDLNAVLDIVRFNLQTEAESAGARINNTPLPTAFRASKSGMIQLFQNLVGNAIKFRSHRPPVIEIGWERLPDAWQFQVRDNGIGLDERYSNKVFLPFNRLADQDLPGSGIGLAICKKIVKLHHGDIWYESEPGKGAVFYFTIGREST